MSSGDRGQRLRAVLINAVLLFVSGALALALAEIVTRWVAPDTENVTGSQDLYQHHPDLGWEKRPGETVSLRTAEYEVTESINSIGLRGPEISREKPDDVRRILLLGDSFVEGYTVDAGDLVSQVLESLLSEPEPGAVQVLNAGTAGYSTDQELLYFLGQGSELDPDVTVLFFYVNDVWFNSQDRYWRGSKPYFEPSNPGLILRGVPVPPPESDRFAYEVQGGRGLVWFLRRVDAWMGARSYAYRLLRAGITNTPTLSGLAIRLGVAEVPGEFRAWQRSPDPATSRAWNVTEQLLARLSQETANVGSRFLVFYIPSQPAVYDRAWVSTRTAYAMSDERWSPTADGEHLREICDRIGLRCVIPVEEFRLEADRIADRGGQLYFEQDRHWTPEGHRLAARILAEELSGTLLGTR